MKVLDTVVCIEILRGYPGGLQWRRVTLDWLTTTWVTACELAYGAANSARPSEHRALVTEFLTTRPILDVKVASALLFGEQEACLRRDGTSLADADLIIASIALTQGAALVTGNTRR